MNYPPLENIKIAAPCKADWIEMYGNDRVRFCGQCNQNVYNLSQMTKEEAEDLIFQTEGRLCVRFYRRKDGSILTKNCPVGLKAIKTKLTATRTHIIASILSFLAYFTGFFWSNPIKMTNHAPKNQVIEHEMGSYAEKEPHSGYIMGKIPIESTKKSHSKPRDCALP